MNDSLVTVLNGFNAITLLDKKLFNLCRRYVVLPFAVMPVSRWTACRRSPAYCPKHFDLPETAEDNI